ncbi:hypothetical protein LCGC14_1490390, partial [marine sediment metagenome]
DYDKGYRSDCTFESKDSKYKARDNKKVLV